MRFTNLVLILLVASLVITVGIPLAKGQSWWNKSWVFRIPVTVANVVDADYVDFPIEVALDNIPEGHMITTAEIRVLWFDGSNWIVVPSQAHGEERYDDGSIKSVKVLFLVNIPAGKSKTYYIYYGNPVAEPIASNKQFKWWTELVGRDKFLYLENSMIRIGIRKTGTAGIASAWVVGGSGADLIGGGAGRHWYYSHYYEDSWHDNGEIVEDELISGPIALIYKYVTNDAAALKYETWLYIFADKNFIKAVINVEHVKDKPVLNPSGHKPMFEYSIVPYNYDKVENTTTYVQLYSTQLKEGVAMVLDNNPPYAPSTIGYSSWESGVRIGCDWGPEVLLAPKRSLTLCRYFIIYKGDDPKYLRAEDLDRLVAYPPIIDIGPEEKLSEVSLNLVKIDFTEAKAVIAGDKAKIELTIKVENKGLKQDTPLTLNIYVINATNMLKIAYQAKETKTPSGVSSEKIELITKPGEYTIRVIATYPGGWSNLIETRISPTVASEGGGLPQDLLIIGSLAAVVIAGVLVFILKKKR